MSCLTCTHRKLACDELRPRCAPCRRSHLKCRYDPSTTSFQIQNETESVKARSSGCSKRKRQKSVGVAGAGRSKRGAEEWTSKSPAAEEPGPHGEALEHVWSSAEPATFWNAGMPWGDNFVEAYPPGLLGSSQFWQGIADASMDPGILLGDDFGTAEPSRIVGSDLGIETGTDSRPEFEDRSQAEGQQLENIPDHLLAQHYTRNLTALYSSKDRGWNYYTYFYNRFSNTHTFVLSALYSWTSAHLFFSETLKSLDHALKYYERCLNQISLCHNIGVTSSPDGSLEINGFAQDVRLSGDELDAIFISLYFLASTDLLAARPRELRKLLRVTTALIELQKSRDRRDGLSFEICNWFCFLDARASAFGVGNSSMITVLGGEEGLVKATKSSRGFLRNEYKMLYPADMIQRDEAHMPLNELVLRLIAIFGEISRHFNEADAEIIKGIRVSLDNVRETLQGIDESDSRKNRVLSTLLTTKAMFHAVEIYYSRTFLPNAPLYVANADATAIIATTDKLYRLLKIPIRDPPPTKFWPIPLVMASIEASDPIYRDWALRKIVDYKVSGEVYVRSVKFVQQVHQLEEECGVRQHLGEIMEGLAEQFIL